MSKGDDTDAWAAWSKEASPADMRYFAEVGAFPKCSHCGEIMNFQKPPLDQGLICCTHCDGGDTIEIS